jgi:hypothetical protein
VVVLDSGYDASQLAQADLDADCLVRLAQHRVFFHGPGSYAGRGQPRLHGARFCLRDPRTNGRSDRSAETELGNRIGGRGVSIVKTHIACYLGARTS